VLAAAGSLVAVDVGGGCCSTAGSMSIPVPAMAESPPPPAADGGGGGLYSIEAAPVTSAGQSSYATKLVCLSLFLYIRKQDNLDKTWSNFYEFFSVRNPHDMEELTNF